MESTVIVILLAGAVIFWKAPFSLSWIPIARKLHRYRQRIFLVILLLAWTTAQTHTQPLVNQSADSSDDRPAPACQES